MKKVFFILCLFAYYYCNAQTVTIQKEGYSLTARKTSNNPPECSISCGTSPTSNVTLEIPENVVINGIECIVTSIPKSAFQNQNNFIGSLHIPDNVRRIEMSAFQGCTGFTGELVLSTNLEYIGNKAFNGCSNITRIVFASPDTQMQNNNSMSGLTGVSSVIIQTGELNPDIIEWIDNNTNVENIIIQTDEVSEEMQEWIQDIVEDPDSNVNNITIQTENEELKDWIDDIIENNPNSNVNISEVNNGATIFIGGDAESPYSWNNANNWIPSGLPSETVDVAIAGELIISSGQIIKVSSITNTSGSITIKDDGQLIYDNGDLSNVRIEKDIIGYGDASNQTGWYAISTPIAGEINNTNYENLIDADNHYDLYYYNESDYTWYNYKNNEFSTLNLGQGYLYANSTGTTVTFVGAPNNKTVEFKLSASSDENISLVGFNLIGNPFTHDIYKGIAISNDLLKEGYYSLSSDGTWITKTDSEPINTCTGILVETKDSSADGQTLEIKKISDSNEKRNSREMLSIKVSNNKYEDVAFIYFDNDNDKGLRKVAHINADAQMIYVPIDGVNYAIAKTDDNTDEIQFAFKASKMGRYTISVDASKCRHDKIYLIDNCTGEKTDILNSDYTFMTEPSDKERFFTLSLNENKDTSSNFIIMNKDDIIINDIEGQGRIHIFDITGRLVIAENANISINIPTESMTNGVYVVRLIDDNGIKTQKIVINK